MRTVNRMAVVAALVFAGHSGFSLHAQPGRERPRAVPGELVVKFKPQTNATDRGRARRAAGAQEIAELTRTPAARANGRVELVRIPTVASVEAVIATLRRDPAVEFAEPNWIYSHQAGAPNDPYFGLQWALDNTAQSVSGYRGTADADIDAPEAWQVARAAGPVYVGVIDEGIDIKHQDLGLQPGGPIWRNPYDAADGIDNDGNGYVDDLHGWDFSANDNSVYDGTAGDTTIDLHGTHVAGTIGARTGNALGVAGVAPGVVIIPAKFLGASGGTLSSAILALDYLTDLKLRHGLNIVATNNSWGGGGYSQALLEAIVRAARAEILFVVAAGNGGSDSVGDDNDALPTYPANYNTTSAAGYDAVIAVTATGQSDELMPWANFGGTTVDLSAPGARIASTTPQNTYGYSSGTSMATPHVTGAIALAHLARGLSGHELRNAVLATVDPVPALNARAATAGRLNLARLAAPQAAESSPEGAEVVLYATEAPVIAGNWGRRSDPAAARGGFVASANLNAAKVTTAQAAPANYFEMSFHAQAGKPYRLWIRGRAENNSWANDSVHVQFDRAVTSTGTAVYRIGTSSSTEVNLEDCSGCGLSGWGWQDNGYGTGTPAPRVYFAATGTQRIRIQIREDGIGIDQIVLSSAKYLSTAPGALKNDTTILLDSSGAAAPPTAVAIDEVVMHAEDATRLAGRWTRIADSTAASGIRLQNGNAGAAKLTTALAAPADYFELTFRADAGKPYRLWLRGKATSNGWANDSVHVQFSASVSATGSALYRIGTSSSTEVNLEECSGCGLSGWGWQDNGYGAGALGPVIRFATSGTHTVRIQVREDGLGIDQVVLSAVKFLKVPPGAAKNDATVLSPSAE